MSISMGIIYRDVMEPAKIHIHMKNPSDADADADLSPDQNLLVPALQLLWFNLVTFVCIFSNEKVRHNTFCVHFN